MDNKNKGVIIINNIQVRNYKVSYNKENLFIYVPIMSKTFITDYDEHLRKIFESGIFTTAACGGRKGDDYLRFSYDKCRSKVYFSHIIYCYYYRGLNEENYKDVIRNFQEELKCNNLQVDHLTEDRHNNTKANLSLISGYDNGRKKSMKQYIKFFGDYIEAFDGIGYRVSYTFISSFARGVPRTIYAYCDTITELRKYRNWLKHSQWRIKSHYAGIAEIDSMYYVDGEYNLFKPFPRLIRKYDTDIMQRYLNGLPRNMFKDSSSFIESV